VAVAVDHRVLQFSVDFCGSIFHGHCSSRQFTSSIIAKLPRRQSQSIARAFDENWEGSAKGERLERLEPLERLERNGSGTTGADRSDSDFKLLNLESLNHRRH
jgi:hypothetical protein